MKRSNFKLLFLVVMSILLIAGCGAKKPAEKPVSQFQAVDLNPEVRAGDYVQKVDNFIIILDKSGSMAESYKGANKLNTARETVSHMNATIPDLKMNGEIRTFGRVAVLSQQFTQLLWGPAKYSKSGLDSGLQKIDRGLGDSPMNLAINAAAGDLSSLQGTIAVIIVTDANQDYMNYNAALKAVTNLKGQYGDRLCIYPIQVGKDPEAQKFLAKIAEAGQCGFATNAADISSSANMAAYVQQVFLAKVEKVEVVEEVVVKPAPCADNDADGVCDKDDQCLNTPKGAKVDYRGCWVLGDVFFDFDKSDIKPRFYSELDEVVKVLNKDSSLKIQIEGHTDNIGTAKYNMALSERRAKSVMEYLVKAGIDQSRLSTMGYGFSKPIATNATDEGRALNRRVEFTPVS